LPAIATSQPRLVSRAGDFLVDRVVLDQQDAQAGRREHGCRKASRAAGRGAIIAGRCRAQCRGEEI